MRETSTTGFPTATTRGSRRASRKSTRRCPARRRHDLARAASEFNTIAELREEIQSRLGGQLEEQLEAQFRTAALDALVAATEPDVAPGLVQSPRGRALERTRPLARATWHQPRRLRPARGCTPEQIQSDIEAEARQALEREIVLEAVADKLGLEASDEVVDGLIREQVEDLGEDADALIAQVREAGRYEALRSDLRLRDALDRIAAEVRRIPVEAADAREKLDPREGKPETGTKLLDPRSKEPA